MLQNVAAHNKLFQGDVVFAIQLRTFAAPIVNDNLGSEAVDRVRRPQELFTLITEEEDEAPIKPSA